MTAEQCLSMKISVWMSGKNTQTKKIAFLFHFLFLDASVFFIKCISEMHLENHRQDCLYPHKSEEAVVLLPGKSCCSTYSYSQRQKGLGSGLCFQLNRGIIQFRSQETSFAMPSDLHWMNCVNFFNSCSFGLVDRVKSVPVGWWVGLDAIVSHQPGVCLPLSPGSHLIRALCVGIVYVGVNQCKHLIATG